MAWILSPYDHLERHGGLRVRVLRAAEELGQVAGRPSRIEEIECGGDQAVALVPDPLDVAIVRRLRGVEVLGDLPLMGRLSDAPPAQRALMREMLAEITAGERGGARLTRDVSAMRLLSWIDQITARRPRPRWDAKREEIVLDGPLVRRSRPIPGVPAGADPVTGVLTDWVGADGVLPAGLSQRPIPAHGEILSQGNLGQPQGVGNTWCSVWWSDVAFDADQEAWLEIEALTANLRFCAVLTRLQAPGTAGVDGYVMGVDRSGGANNQGFGYTYRLDNGAYTQLGAASSFEGLTSNSQIAGRSQGSTHTLSHRPAGQGWTDLFGRTDATYGAGHLGWWATDTTTRVDRMGGGNLAQPDPPPAPPPVRTRALWVFEAIAHDGTPIAELAMRARTVTLARNAGGSARGSLGLLEAGAPELANALRLGQVDLRVSRDDRRVWQGSLEAAQGQLESLTGRVEFAGVSMWEILASRYVALGLEIAATEATQVAWQLISDAQAVTHGDLGIVAGDLPDSVARTRRWDTPTSVAAAVQELAELADGFDWSLTPQQAGEGDGLRWDAWWPRQGTDAGLVLEWGRNVAGVSFQASAAAVRNRATARTSNQIGVSAEDLTSQGLLRLREAEVSAGDIDDASVLADRAAGELRPTVQILPRLTCMPGAVDLDSLGIGDTVEVQVRHGWLQLSGPQRVEQIEISISDEGQEQLTITVQEPEA